MDAKELRIGNYIFNEYRKAEQICFKITNTSEILGMKINSISERFIKPIELTEEWLLKFGFEYDEETKSYSILKSLDRFDYLFEIKKFDEYFEPDFLRIQIKYVHQLQNLYFCLTGEELKLN